MGPGMVDRTSGIVSKLYDNLYSWDLQYRSGHRLWHYLHIHARQRRPRRPELTEWPSL